MRKPYEKYVKQPYTRKIKIRLAELDMNVSDLARKVEIDPRVLHNMLTKGRPCSENWPLVAKALNMRLDEIAEIGVFQPTTTKRKNTNTAAAA
jgi:lambda repressor-like predicted transcriptional regulator